MNPLAILAALLVALVPFNWAVAVYLLGLSRINPDVTTLRSRAQTQVILAVCSTIGGFLGLAYLTNVAIGPIPFTVLLAALVLLPSVPGIWWTSTYLRDGFR